MMVKDTRELPDELLQKVAEHYPQPKFVKGGDVMRDKIGPRPTIIDRKHALDVIRIIAEDKRGHVMLNEHYAWLELRLKEIGVIARKGLKCRK